MLIYQGINVPFKQFWQNRWSSFLPARLALPGIVAAAGAIAVVGNHGGQTWAATAGESGL